ncbi:DUF262 domain-containing protein [Microbispora hainanensis]|uniref:DUF262 domain-containing protein n=1 Tax=Microbispora hainanensis TaxID=568844 RepID=UPI002E2CD858|nr:DUF262 domain-containing protein [Microbispora hainanensis]
MAAVARPRVEEIRLVHLPGLVRDGRLRIPSFQRSFRWDRDDVVRLFDSVLRGYPIGALLMWQRPAAAARPDIGPLRIDAPEAADACWVVDGQHLVHPRDVPARAIRAAIGQADPEILRSHVIDEAALRDLPEHEDLFLARRFDQLATAIEEHVQENALFGFPDGPDLIRPE